MTNDRRVGGWSAYSWMGRDAAQTSTEEGLDTGEGRRLNGELNSYFRLWRRVYKLHNPFSATTTDVAHDISFWHCHEHGMPGRLLSGDRGKAQGGMFHFAVETHST